MPQARAAQVDLDTTLYYHCVSRCVRRAFLCGDDEYSGKNFDHRKGWIVERLRLLSSVYAVDVCAYAVMSNHVHLVIRVDPTRAASWTDDEVQERYEKLFKLAKGALDDLDDTRRDERLALWRSRLGDLSWMMRSLNEWIARRANKEDGCTGRFWEGRFSSQPLLGDEALLTCMTYVDLNPVRAGICHRLDDAEFTSIEARLRDTSERADAGASDDEVLAPRGLMPFADQVEARCAKGVKDAQKILTPLGFRSRVAPCPKPALPRSISIRRSTTTASRAACGVRSSAETTSTAARTSTTARSGSWSGCGCSRRSTRSMSARTR